MTRLSDAYPELQSWAIKESRKILKEIILKEAIKILDRAERKKLIKILVDSL